MTDHLNGLPIQGRIRTLALLLFIALLTALNGCQNQPSQNQPPQTQPTRAQTPSKDEVAEVDVLIVGAGLSGLVTAYELQKAGLTYHLLEWAPRVGGRVRTGRYPNQTAAEVGLAEFWEGNPTLEIIAELGLPVESAEPGISSFILDGELQPFTTYETNHDFLRAVLKDDYPAFLQWDQQVEKSLHVMESGEIPPELLKLKDISFKKWLEKQGLPPRVVGSIKAIIEPEIGTTIDRIGALDGIAEWHIFAGEGAIPRHVINGNQDLTETLADRIGRQNISLNTQVTNIVDGSDGVTIRAVDAETFENRNYQGKVVVTTIPLYRLFEIQFEPRLDDEIYRAIHSQTWGAYFTAHVLMNKTAERYWIIDGVDVMPILTGTALGVMYPGFDTGPEDKVLINLLVTGNAAEAYNSRTMSFDDVQRSLENAFEKTFPGITEEIQEWTFYRYHPRAIACWPVGRSRFDDLSNSLRKAHGRLYFAGDFTESSHSDGATKSALRVSKQIIERLK